MGIRLAETKKINYGYWLTVCHVYGGGVGYDKLVLGLSYSRGFKVLNIEITSLELIDFD